MPTELTITAILINNSYADDFYENFYACDENLDESRIGTLSYIF